MNLASFRLCEDATYWLQSSSTCISECGIPSWVCFLKEPFMETDNPIYLSATYRQYGFCAVSPTQFEHIIQFLCVVSPLLAPCSYLCYAVSPPQMWWGINKVCAVPLIPVYVFLCGVPPKCSLCLFHNHNFVRSLLLQKNFQFYKLVSYNDQVTVIRNYKLAHKDFQLQIEIPYLNEKMEIRSFHLGRT